MRVLALDVGDRRIGVALSDPLGVLATPLPTILRSTMPSDVDAVREIAAQRDAAEIVVGLPLTLSGKVGPQARRVQTFIRRLSERVEVPVTEFDERYSTVEAERLLRQSGVEPSRDRKRVDAAAAAVILQAYLERRRSAGNHAL